MKRVEVPGGYRFVTFSCHRRLGFFNNSRIAELFVLAMVAARLKYRFELFAWVVMPEHVHLLLRPRADGPPLWRILKSIKQPVADRVIARWKALQASILERIIAEGRPRFWQKGGGFDRNVRDAEEFTKEVRYIHRNPVERGLVERPEEWKRSSVRWWMGLREAEVECDPPPGHLKDWKGFM